MTIPLARPRVSVIGTRRPSIQGIKNAQMITKPLVRKNAIIVSGLAAGIDTIAHQTAIDMRGQTIAVLGTPIDRTYPKENLDLQKEIMENHLAVSQYPIGYPITKKNFVSRNRTMALISDATVIIEAGNTSGTFHQAWETLRLGRPLFILESVVNDHKLDWPKKMIQYGAITISDPEGVFELLPSGLSIPNIFAETIKCE